MFDIATTCVALGSSSDTEPPYLFDIGELGCIFLEKDCRFTRIVLNSRVDPRNLENAVTDKQSAGLPLFLSKSPGGRLCYHIVTDASEDQTTQLLDTLDKLIRKLATRDG